VVVPFPSHLYVNVKSERKIEAILAHLENLEQKIDKLGR